jgi:hypothetical protein
LQSDHARIQQQAPRGGGNIVPPSAVTTIVGDRRHPHRRLCTKKTSLEQQNIARTVSTAKKKNKEKNLAGIGPVSMVQPIFSSDPASQQLDSFVRTMRHHELIIQSGNSSRLRCFKRIFGRGSELMKQECKFSCDMRKECSSSTAVFVVSTELNSLFALDSGRRRPFFVSTQ